MLAAHRLFVSAKTALSPDQIPDLEAWWKADALGLADGASVTSWADSSGGGHTLTPWSTNSPVNRTSIAGFNGEPCVEFAVGNANCGMSTPYAAALNPANMTVAFIFQLKDELNSWAMLQSIDSGGYQMAYSAPGGELVLLRTALSGSGFVNQANSATVYDHVTTNSIIATATSAGHLDVYRSGDDTGAGHPTDGNAWGQASTSATFVGQASTFGNKTDYYLAEACIWGHVLTADEIAGVQAYFAAKYGL